MHAGSFNTCRMFGLRLAEVSGALPGKRLERRKYYSEVCNTV